MPKTAASRETEHTRAADRATWWPPAPRALSFSRGNGFAPGVVGVLCLLGGPAILAEAFGLVQLGDRPESMPAWAMIALGLGALGLGVWFALGRAGAVLDPSGRYLHQWWGLIRWPWHTRTLLLERCRKVRVRPRLLPLTSHLPTECWFVSLVDARGQEYDLHRLPARADAERIARTVGERTALAVELRADLPRERGWYWLRKWRGRPER